MKKAFVIILAASMVGGCALMEGYGELDVFAFPVFVRFSKGERKTNFLGPCGLLGIWDSTTNGVEYVLIPTLLTYMEPGKEFASPLFSWSDSGTFKILMTGREVHNSVTNLSITPLMGVKSGTSEGEWLFPLWYRKSDLEYYDNRLALLDEDRLPDGADNWWHSERKKKLFLLLGEEESVAYSRHNVRGTHRITHEHKQCYIPLARQRKKWSDYDRTTRKKLADGTSDRLDFLIVNYERKVGGVEGFDRIQWGIPDESWPRILCYKSDEKNGAEFSVFMRPIWQEHSGAKPRNAEKKGEGHTPQRVEEE
jgi:hypothetical protein